MVPQIEEKKLFIRRDPMCQVYQKVKSDEDENGHWIWNNSLTEQVPQRMLVRRSEKKGQ